MTGRLLGFVLLISVAAFPCFADDIEDDKARSIINGDQVDDSNTATALQAMSEGNIAEMKRLLELDPGVYRRIPNLYFVVMNGSNPDVIEYFRDQGKIRVSDLDLAVIRGNVDAVKKVLAIRPKRTVPVDQDRISIKQMPTEGLWISLSISPLRRSVRKGQTEIAGLLIAAGYNVHEHILIPDYRTHTILNEAIDLGHVEIARLLIAGGAHVNAFDEKWNLVKQNDPKSILLAMDFAKLKPEERSKRLKASGEFVFEGHDYDVHAYSPLFTAINSGDSRMVAMLLDNGANPNVFIEDGTRPLNVAVGKGNPDIVRLLLKHGADVHAVTKKDNRTALWWCENVHRHRDIADILRAAGAK